MEGRNRWPALKPLGDWEITREEIQFLGWRWRQHEVGHRSSRRRVRSRWEKCLSKMKEHISLS